MTGNVGDARLIALEKAAESKDYMEDFAKFYAILATAPCARQKGQKGQKGACDIV